MSRPTGPQFWPPFKPCPCGSGRSYSACCQPFHTGERDAPSPEALMRSRYAAYALADADYVRRTWHPDTVPAELDLNDGVKYTGLRIHRAEGDGVEFTASMKGPDGQAHRMRERSRFVHLGGRWVYLDAAE